MSPVRSNHVADATIVIAQTDTQTFTATIQLLGINGLALTNRGAVGYYLSTDANGDTVATTSTDVTSLAIGTDGACMEDNVSGNVWGRLVSESDGDIDLAIVVPSAKVVYLNLIMPDGTLITSDAMTYG